MPQQPACKEYGKKTPKRIDILLRTGYDFHPSLTGKFVETVENFKYLGTALDSQMSFSVNTGSFFKKLFPMTLLSLGVR